MKNLSVFIFGISLLILSCSKNSSDKQIIDQVLNQWHEAAAHAEFETYFGLMADNAVFIGTDATENWTKNEFETYAKPHFDQGKAWQFTCLERTIFISTDGKTAWFDELLDTSYKICRGSGILIKTAKGWKIVHYVLSLTVPNELAKVVVNLKDSTETVLIQQLKSGNLKK
jgi:ketosteroid isomerase-like protein